MLCGEARATKEAKHPEHCPRPTDLLDTNVWPSMSDPPTPSPRPDAAAGSTPPRLELHFQCICESCLAVKSPRRRVLEPRDAHREEPPLRRVMPLSQVASSAVTITITLPNCLSRRGATDKVYLYRCRTFVCSPSEGCGMCR